MNVERWFAGSSEPPEHVVACAFAVSLPFAEHALLNRLHRAGARHLTVLVGAGDYAQSFADLAATRYAGVFYAFHRVRLPGPLAAFHPKLYLLAWRDRARLLVASANLTPSGFRSNLEIADELRLDAGAPSDVAAFAAYAGLLEALPQLDSTLDPRLRARLASAAGAVRALAGRCTERVADQSALNAAPATGTVRLLHSAAEPLLDQVSALVPAAAVRRVTIVSPFFDDRSAGLLALARAFARGPRPPALRVVIDGRSTGELDGAALRGYGAAVTVERLYGLASEPGIWRRLHGKALVLEGAQAAWVIVGSANATSAAWRRSAAGGGNLEAVTVREVPVAAARQLLKALVVEPVDHRDAQRTPRTHDLGEDAALVIHAAAAVGGVLELVCSDGPWLAKAEPLVAHLMSRAGSAVLPLAVHQRSPGVVVLRSVEGSDVLDSGDAVAVTVEASPVTAPDVGGLGVSAPAWVDKPLYQELAPELRAGVRALHQLGDGLYADSADPLHDAAQFLARLTVRLAADLAALRQVPETGGEHAVPESGHAPSGKSPGREGGTDDGAWDEAWDEVGDEGPFLPTGGAEAGRPLPGGATARRLGGVHFDAHLRSTQRLFDGIVAAGLRGANEDADTEAASPQREVARLGRRVHASTDEGETEPSVEAPALTPGGRRLLQHGLESLRRAVDRVLGSPWSVAAVPQLTGMLDALLVAMLRYLQHLEHWDAALRASCADALHDAWTRVWSTHGYLVGPSRGWYVRALAEPALGEALQDAYRPPERMARVAALAAMTAVARSHASTGGVGATVPVGVLSGLALVSGGRSLRDGAVGALVRDHCAAFAANHGAADPEGGSADDVLQRLAAPPLAETIDGRLLLAWLPVIRAEQARLAGHLQSPVTLPGDVPPRVAAAYGNALRAGRRLASVESTAAGIHCGGCKRRLPTAWRTALSRPDAALTCDACHRLLAPVAWQQPAVASLLPRLEAALRAPSEFPGGAGSAAPDSSRIA